MSWWIFGLSSLVGQAVQARLRSDDPRVQAWSRFPRAPLAGVDWHLGGLEEMASCPRPPTTLISLGSIELLARRLGEHDVRPQRVLALSSTSAGSKRESPDASERALAATLLQAETRLQELARQRDFRLIILRPTLIYGAGTERSLGRIVQLASRWRLLPLPRSATGLRQPVHADDVAAVVLAWARQRDAVEGVFDLGGGERLAYHEMVRRLLASRAPGARLWRVPDPLFHPLVILARGLGLASGFGEGAERRLAEDLLAGDDGIWRRLGVQPRAFQP